MKINIKQYTAEGYSNNTYQKKEYIHRIENGLVKYYFDDKIINETIYIR